MLNQVDNDESVLLLYLAGELSAQQRAVVERRLAAEPALREEKGRLEAAQAAVAEWFTREDAALAAGDTEGRGRASAAAVRRVSRAFVERRLAVEEAARAAAAKNDSIWPKSLLPRWAYPLTAAAAIIVGLLSLVQWGGSLVGSDRAGRNRTEWGEVRGEDPGGAPGWRFPGSRFAAGTYGIDEDDIRSLQMAAGAYDVSTMFQPDVD